MGNRRGDVILGIFIAHCPHTGECLRRASMLPAYCPECDFDAQTASSQARAVLADIQRLNRQDRSKAVNESDWED